MSVGSLSSFCPDGDVSAVLAEMQARFVCQKCGKCCRVGGNPVLTKRDVGNIALYLNCSPRDTSRIPVKPLAYPPGVFYLTLTSPCFFQDKVTCECTIHDAKPQNCREWPFISLGRGMCKLEHVLVCPVASKMIYEHLGVPCKLKSVVSVPVPRCLHQRADEIGFSVVCVVNNNEPCPYAGESNKEDCLCFVRVDPEEHPETGLP